MTTIKTDYNNTELLDQELTIKQLEGVAGADHYDKDYRNRYQRNLRFALLCLGLNPLSWDAQRRAVNAAVFKPGTVSTYGQTTNRINL